MNKIKKITALLLCVIMMVYAPMTAFATSDIIGTGTTIVETTTPTDPEVGCTECGGMDAHLETCSQYVAAAFVEIATITLDSIPAGAIAELENVQGTKATIIANPVSLYSDISNGAEGIKLNVESGIVIDLITKYTFTTEFGSQVFYHYDYFDTNEALNNAAITNRYISAEEISIQGTDDSGNTGTVVPDADVTKITDSATGLMVSGDIPADLTLVASPKTLEESGIDTTVYPIDGPSLFYGVNLLLGSTGYMTFFSITVTFPEAAVAECGLTAGDSYNVYTIHDGVTDVTGPFVYSGGSISADFTNLGVMGIAKAAEEGNTPGGDVPEDETLVDLKALHGDAVVSYLDEEIEFQVNSGKVNFYDGYESDVHVKETADAAGAEIEAFVEITYADGFVLYQYAYYGEDDAFKEIVKYYQFIAADDVTEITPEMKQPCAICGFKNCKTAHLYCEECKEFDCGVKHPKPEPIRPITKPEMPSVEPDIPEGFDAIIVDAEGNAVTDGIQLYDGERVSFSAWSKLEEEGYVDYQWQICYDKKNNLWTNIQGQDEQGIVMSPAMVESIIDAVGSAVIRCQMTSGDVVQYSETIPVTVESGAGLFAAVKEFFAAPLTLAKNAVATVANALTDTADAAETTGVSAVAEDAPVKNRYSVVITYEFDNNVTAADAYTATLTEGTDFTTTVTFPTVMGYLPYLNGVQQNSLALNITDIKADVTYTVKYLPTNVDYTVIHYQQNVDNDNYTEIKRETLQGLTKSNVPDVANDYAGFYALLYDCPEIAADGSTVVEIYYDREYILVNFNLDGGYGGEPVYARYGAPLEVKNPTKAGHTFLGWSLDGTNSVKLPETVPAENVTYKALWEVGEKAKVTVVFWGETANCTDAAKEYDYYGSGTTTANVGSEYTYGDESLNCATEAHTHTDECINCGKEAHQHTEACYTLTCTTPEHSAHVDACYTCGQSGHTHSVECYAGVGKKQTVYTDLPNNPSEGLVYDHWWYRMLIYIKGTWYEYSGSTAAGSVAPTTCGKTESTHNHTDECLGCNKVIHTHSNYLGGCYDLTCTKEIHTHNANCNGCGKPEHTHTANCTISVSNTFPSNLWTKEKSETKTVLADGTTIVNVYYDRTEFTLTYKYNYKSYNPQTTETITAKWGDDISDEYVKIAQNAGSTFWTENSNGYSGPFTNYFEIMPQANKTYYCDGSRDGSSGNMNYWGQDLNGDYTINLFTVTNVGGYSVTVEDRYEFEGFTYHHGTEIGSSCKGASFYYTRNSYKLDFNNGLEVTKSETVKFEAPLSSYATYVPTVPNIYEAGSVEFAGWYLNPECTGDEYKLAEHTMPASNLILYAKWVPVNHTVKIFLTEEDSKIGRNQLGDTQMVAHRELATAPEESEVVHPESDKYNFISWFYKDADGNEKAFDFSIPITQDLVLYAKWNADALMEYVIYYKYEDSTTGEVEIAERLEGSVKAGLTKTFDAKGGTDLYADYQEGYFPLVMSHSIEFKIDHEGKYEYTFWYVQKPSVPYTVYYVTKDPNTILSSTDTVELDGKIYYRIAKDEYYPNNKKAVVTENFKSVLGYMPDAYQKRLIIDGTDGAENKIIFIYVKDEVHAYYKITHYTQNLDGETWTEYTSSEAVGDINTTYTADPISIDGFTYDSGVEGTQVSGVLTAAGLELKLYYVRNSYPYEVRYLEQGSGKVLATSKSGEKGKYGQVISERAIDIKNYTAVDPTSQTLTIRIEESQTEAKLNIITFYYVEKEVTINYVVVGPNGLADGSGTVTPGSETFKVDNGTATGSTAAANTGYRFVGWYSDEACTKQVSTKAMYVPVKPENGWPDVTTYYAKFEVALVDLIITKSGCSSLDENQCFLFTVTKPDGSTIDVVIEGNGSVTIKDLLVGEGYKVTEKTDWSWRYNFTNATARVGAKSASVENGISFELTAAGETVTFTNTRSIIYWLSGDCLAENRWDGNNGNTQPLARKEDDEVEA